MIRYALAMVALLIAACAAKRPSPSVHETYAADGAVSGQVVDTDETIRYTNSPGTSYRGAGPSAGNPQPEYPPRLLSKLLPPVIVDVQLVVGGDGMIDKVSASGPTGADPAFADAVIDVVQRWTFTPLERLSDDGIEALPFTLHYRFTFRQVNGRAIVESGSTAAQDERVAVGP